MRKALFCRVVICIVAALFFMVLHSCVKEEYELSQDTLNTNVTLFQEGISLPLGKTRAITLGSMMGELGDDVKQYLSNLEGAYMFRMADTLDFSERLSELKGIIDIDKIEVSQDYSFNLSNVDLSGLQIDLPQFKPAVLDISSIIYNPEITLPEFNENIKITTKLTDLDESVLDLNFSDYNVEHVGEFASFANQGDKFHVSESILSLPESDVEMSYAQIATFLNGIPGAPKLPDISISSSFDNIVFKLPIEISLPKQIKSLDNISLGEDAAIEVGMAIGNSLFTSGEIDPTIDIDLHNIFDLRDEETGVTAQEHINDYFLLTGENNWQQSHKYHAKSLAITGKDFVRQPDGTLLLKKDVEVTASGLIEEKNLKTTIRHLHNHDDQPTTVTVSLKFHDFIVDNVEIEIDPITLEKEMTIPIEIPGISLPSIVEKVEYIDLDQSKPMEIKIQSMIPDAFKTLSINIDKLEVIFPEGFSVKHDKYDAQARKLIYTGISLAEGLDDKVVIDRLTPPDLDGGQLSYKGEIMVMAIGSARGAVMLDKVLEEKEDLSFDVEIDYKPELADYGVLIDDYVYDIKIDPVSFSEKLPDSVKDMGVVSVYLEKVNGTNPTAVINLDYPEDESIRILPKEGEGLKISFPEVIVFDNLPSEYNYNPEDNSISFTGEQVIPKTISLPISRLDIVPEKLPGKDGYWVSGEVNIIGGVRLAGTRLTKKLIEKLLADNAKVSFDAEIPVLKPEKVNVGEYSAAISHSMEFSGLNIDGLPEMVKSIDKVILKDVELSLEVDASSIASVVSDADMTLELNVKLPEIVVIDHKDVGEDNVLHVSESMGKDNKIVVGPYVVKELDLSGIDFTSDKVSLGNMKIDVDGRVLMQNVSVDLNKLEGKELDVTLKGGLCSKGSDKILIDKINAVVDYQIDPIQETVDLSSLTGSLGDKFEMNLDLNRFNLILEVKTNLCLPVNADLKIIPYYDGQPAEDKILKPKAPLSLKYSESAKDTVYTRFWISNTDKGMPADFEWVNIDLLSLLLEKPESLQLCIEAGTPENAALVFEPESKYALSANYAFELPLELGEEFRMEYADTLRGLPEQLGTIMSYGSIAMGGKVTNSLPVQFDLEFFLLDAEDNLIPMSEGAGKQTIKASNYDGSPSETALDVRFGIDTGAETPEISAILVKFVVTSGGKVGAFRDDSFIQVELNARIPEGITLDLNDATSEDGENNQKTNL